MTIDAHCHLSQVDYTEPVDTIIQKALDNGVQNIMAVACDPKDWDEEIQLLNKHGNLFGAIGIHPEYADQNQDLSLNVLKKLFLENSRLLSVGEIGLDYHEAPNTQEQQKTLFIEQIKLAHELHKPIMIHTRDAEKDTMEILATAKGDGILTDGGVIHCFTGTQALADFAIGLGFYISISGVITFKNAQSLRDVVQSIPLDRLLVETDAPWLAPVPYRGQKNQPSFVQYTLKKLAELKGVSDIEMERITTQNFNDLFLRGIKCK